MTPLAHFITKQLTLQSAKADPKVWAHAAELTRLISGCQFFEVTEIEAASHAIFDTLRKTDEVQAEGCIRHLSFLPADKVWIEKAWDSKRHVYSNSADTNPAKKWEAFILENTEAGIYASYVSRRVFANRSQESASFYVIDLGLMNMTTSAEGVSDLVKRMRKVNEAWDYLDKNESYDEDEMVDTLVDGTLEEVAFNEREDALREVDQAMKAAQANRTPETLATLNEAIKRMDDSFLKYEAASAKEDLAFVHIILSLINTPNIVGRDSHAPHKGLMKDVRRKFGSDKGLNTGWTQLRLHIYSKGDGSSGGGEVLTGRKALHFCRAHLRLTHKGKLVIVRGHLRGNPDNGTTNKNYKVMP